MSEARQESMHSNANHVGGFSSGGDDVEKDHPRAPDRLRGGFRGRRGNSARFDDQVRYGSRFVVRTRGNRGRDGQAAENSQPTRRRSYSDGHGFEPMRDEAAGGDRRNYERRRPRAFGDPHDRTHGNGYRNTYGGGGRFGNRRRFRDDDDEQSYQQRRTPAPFRKSNMKAVAHDGEEEKEREQTYTTLSPDEFKKHFFSVKVSNLPKSKQLKGLFHHFSCFGNVLNIYSLSDEVKVEGESKPEPIESEKHIAPKSPPKAEKEEPNDAPKALSEPDEKSTHTTPDEEESQAVILSYDTLYSARHLRRESGSVMFNRKLIIERYFPPNFQHPPRRSNGPFDGHRRRSKDSSIKEAKKLEVHHVGKFNEEILVHLFGLMDLKTRCLMSTVCRAWHRAVQKVQVLPHDVPKELKIVVSQASNESTQREVVSVKFDKEQKIFEVSFRRSNNRFVDMSLEYSLERLARQIGPGVESISLNRVAIKEYTLITLAMFENVKDIRFDNCSTSGRIYFGLLISFFDHFKGRLTVEPAGALHETALPRSTKPHRRSSDKPKSKKSGESTEPGWDAVEQHPPPAAAEN